MIICWKHILVSLGARGNAIEMGFYFSQPFFFQICNQELFLCFLIYLYCSNVIFLVSFEIYPTCLLAKVTYMK